MVIPGYIWNSAKAIIWAQMGYMPIMARNGRCGNQSIPALPVLQSPWLMKWTKCHYALHNKFVSVRSMFVINSNQNVYTYIVVLDHLNELRFIQDQCREASFEHMAF